MRQPHDDVENSVMAGLVEGSWKSCMVGQKYAALTVSWSRKIRERSAGI